MRGAGSAPPAVSSPGQPWLRGPFRHLGLAALAERASTTHGTASRYQAEGRLPAPDIILVEGARQARGWLPATIDAWLATRPGRGARTDLARRD